MNWFDVALIALAVLCVVSGIRQGLSRSGLGLIAIAVAFLSAAWLYPAEPARFVIVFVLLIAAGGFATAILGRWFQREGLTWLDRVLGGAFGLANAALFAMLAIVAVMAFAPRVARHYAAHSTFAPYALNAAHTAADAVPDEMKFRVDRTYRELVTLLPPDLRKAAPRLREL